MYQITVANQIDQAVTPDLLNRFISYLDTSTATVATYTRSLRQFIQYLAKNGIASPSRQDIIAYREHLKETGHKPATVQLYIVAVRRFLEWAESEGILRNTARGIKGARRDRTHKRDALTARQARMTLNKINRSTESGARDYAILAVMISGGLRPIEVVRANREDLRNVADESVLFLQGKGRDERSEYIHLVEDAERAIRDYLSIRGGGSGSDPLFGSTSNNNRGGRMTTRSVSRIVKNLLLAVGISSDRLTAHSLRHTAGTLNIKSGGSLEQTQELLRHSDPATTQIYIHNVSRAANKSESRIWHAIWGDGQ